MHSRMEATLTFVHRLEPEDRARANFYGVLAALYGDAPGASLLAAIGSAQRLPDAEASVADLALNIEHRHPVVAAMLLDEIERAELHDPETLPDDAVTLGSDVDFVDDKTHQLRKVKLVLPAHANIAEGRISILTPMGAALYGLRAGSSIVWPPSLALLPSTATGMTFMPGEPMK